MIDSLQKEKQELEQIIKDNGWETVRIVLFDKTNREPFAIYFFKEDGKYVIQSAGERGGFEGSPTSFDNFEEAKASFIERIKLKIRVAIRCVKDDGYYAYPSPLWDQYAIQLETVTIDAVGVVDDCLELLLVDPNHWFIKEG